MRRFLVVLFGMLAVVVTFASPALAQGRGGGGNGGGGNGGGGGSSSDELVIVLRDAAADGLLPDNPLDVYVDGESGVHAAFSSGGDVALDLAKGKGKKPPARSFAVDFSLARLESLEGAEVIPPFIQEANGAGNPIVLFPGDFSIQADTGTGSNLDGGVKGVSMADGPQAVRLKIFFDDPDGNSWKLGWTAGPFRPRGADWGEVSCVQSSDPADPSSQCVAWRVRLTINGSPGPEDDFAGMQSMGSQPDGGLWLVSTEIAVCLQNEVSVNDCTAIVRQ